MRKAGVLAWRIGCVSRASNKIWDPDALQIPCIGGEPPGTRTMNPLIKSQQGTEQTALTLNFSGFIRYS